MADSIFKDKYIFGYLDILGYKNLVHNTFKNGTDINFFNDLFDKTIFEHFAENTETFVSGLSNKSYVKLIDAMKISLFSDSILLRIPLTNNDKENYFIISFFLAIISFLILFFISNVKLFLRGGICIEQHFEVIEPNKQFIFSKALILAYQNEQRANSIRILFDKSSLKMIDVTFTTYPHAPFIYQDIDDEFCLDYYYPFRVVNYREKFLPNIVDAANTALIVNQKDLKIISKYISFIQFHNYRVIMQYNLPQYKIDMNMLHGTVNPIGRHRR